MIMLHPPLALIERELFDHEDEDKNDGDVVGAAPWEGAASPPMPAHLLALVERKVAAACAPEAPAVGQIRCLAAIPGRQGPGRRLGRTCGVLLGRCIGGKRWAGWMVVQEVDYASDQDLVLQEDDGLFAPEAALVQTWNPVEIVLCGDEAILGKLSAERLGAVGKLADPVRADAGFVPARPGRIGAWDIDGATTVVTGTPLGDSGDPRLGYRQLYRRLAAECAAAAVASGATAGRPETAPRWLAWLRQTFVTPAWTFGAMAVAVFQAAWLLGAPHAVDEPALYRSAAPAHADTCRTRIRVMFKLDVPYAELVSVLRRIDAVLVSGPSENGEIWILPAPEQDPFEAAAMLRQSRLVEQADVILPDSRRCRR